MELIITIPKEFEDHFKQDKFKDSLGRICYDIENAFKQQEGVSGRYEWELAEMLDDAFAKTQVSPTESELNRTKRALWIARANAAKNAAVFWDEVHTNEVLGSKEVYDIDYYVLTDKLKRTPFEWHDVFKKVANKCRAYADKFKEE